MTFIFIPVQFIDQRCIDNTIKCCVWYYHRTEISILYIFLYFISYCTTNVFLSFFRTKVAAALLNKHLQISEIPITVQNNSTSKCKYNNFIGFMGIYLYFDFHIKMLIRINVLINANQMYR